VEKGRFIALSRSVLAKSLPVKGQTSLKTVLEEMVRDARKQLVEA
jgi:hypothetical protein